MEKFEIFSTSNGQFRFRLIAGNGENVLASENYVTKQACKNGIDSVKVNSQHENRFEKRTSDQYQPYFVLKAVNGEVIGVSQMYSSSSARDHGISVVMRIAAHAPIYDLT